VILGTCPVYLGGSRTGQLAKAGIRRIRLHDLRHTFGSLLIQNGASIVYVKEQMGHSSLQVTVDIYGHLIPGANVCFVDRLDAVLAEEVRTSPRQSATPAPQREMEIPPDLLQVVEEFGGGGRTRTYDLRIMRPSL
jgi:integrase